MNCGASPQPDQYYGYLSTQRLGTNSKEIRKMKRTELSRERKSNPSAKSLSRERDSSISNPISKGLVPNATSVLKMDNNQYPQNHLSKYHDQNLPSSAEPQNTTNLSIRKSRLQISTGVIGIRMDSVSPTSIVSHPSKVLIFNESSSGKKGSKTKLRKSILYVEYNNFMTQLSSNRSMRKSLSKDEKNLQKNTHVQSATSLQTLPLKLKKPQLQQFCNFLPRNLQNEYFTGMNRNCVCPLNGQPDRKDHNRKTQKIGFLGHSNKDQNHKPKYGKELHSPKNQASKLKLSRSDSQTIQTPKHEISIVNLSITSTSKNKLQSPRFGTVSPRLFKMQHNANASKINKNKISMHELASQKSKHIQQISNKNSKVIDSRESVMTSRYVKKQSYGIQVNIAETLFPKDIPIAPATHQQKDQVSQQYFQKNKTEEIQNSKKNTKNNHGPNLKQYKTEKQLGISRESKKSSKNSPHKTTQSEFQNPYNLAKNESLIKKYQQRKNPNQFNEIANEINRKNIKFQLTNHSPTVNFYTGERNNMGSNFCSNDSESVVSKSSIKGGRKLMKVSEGTQEPNSKMSMKSHSKSKLNMPPSPRVSKTHRFEPKTPQPYSHYKDSSSSNQGQKSSQNQVKISPEGRIINKSKHMEDYNSTYFTPNPHSLAYGQKSQNQLNFVPQERGSQLVSQLSYEKSGPSSQELQSEASQLQSIEENLSIKSGKLLTISEARLKRQQIAQKNKVRLSRNSERSNQGGSNKKIKLNPLSKIESSLGNSMVSNQSQNDESFTQEKNESHNQMRNQATSNEQSVKNEDRVRSTTHEGVKFLKKVQIQGKQDKQSRNNSPNRSPCKSPNKSSNRSPSAPRKSEQSNLTSQSPKRKKSQVKASVIKSNLKHDSRITIGRPEQKTVFQSDRKTPSQQSPSNTSNQKSRQGSQNQKYSPFNQKQTNSVNDSSMKRSNYKKQLEVENVQSEIEQHMVSSKPSTKKLSNTLKNKQKNQNESSHEEPKSPQKQLSHHEESDFSRSSYSAQESANKSPKRQNIKKSVHSSTFHNHGQTIGSKHMKSSVSVKSGRNLKPFNMQNPNIDDFLAYVEEYDIAIGFLYLYVENTVSFYCNQNFEEANPQVQLFINKIRNTKAKQYEQKYEKLAFLVMKKYLYEKNRIIKCLRGLENNIFNLTGLQIPDKILQKFMNHEKTKEKLKQYEIETKELFKELEEKFRSLRLKAENKKDKLIKLETPYDDFTRYIVAILMEELNEITTEIDELEIETGSKLSSSNPSLPLGTRSMGPKSLTSVIAQEILTSEERGLEVMEIVFLLSELQGRKVKKLELLSLGEIEFESFYERRIEDLLSVYDFFEELKYPSDKVNVKKNVK